MTTPFDDLQVFYGDLHNHCDVGYGHGSIENAFDNAALQLDFVCVTPHGYWHDLPTESRLAAVADYHVRGFERTAAQWSRVQDIVRQRHQPGQFVTFLGYEWHSRRYGDHNVYFKGDTGDLIRADDMPDLRAALRQVRAGGTDTMLIPHHIGYKAGYRGINWAEFDPEFIHLVEIMSMHGASESADARPPYLHTMGPLDWESSLQYGLAQGHRVGVVGSTDHHSAHPGSYGHGRVGVWASALTRDAIWDALTARRTVALTGDRIALAFALNGAPMGSVVAPHTDRHIDVQVTGGAALDTLEIVHNHRVIYRWVPPLTLTRALPGRVKVHFEVGWGERGENIEWNVDLRVVDGHLMTIEPRFRGHAIVEPQADEQDSYQFSRWEEPDPESVHLTTRTWGNATPSTASMQGLCVELEADAQTRLVGQANQRRFDIRVSDLLAGPRVFYTGGFLSPVAYFHRAVPQHDYTTQVQYVHRVPAEHMAPGGDWYTVRVRQRNDQWAWSSPIWV